MKYFYLAMLSLALPWQAPAETGRPKCRKHSVVYTHPCTFFSLSSHHPSSWLFCSTLDNLFFPLYILSWEPVALVLMCYFLSNSLHTAVSPPEGYMKEDVEEQAEPLDVDDTDQQQTLPPEGTCNSTYYFICS